MTRLHLHRLLRPLGAASVSAGIRHFSVIGSALAKPIEAVGDLDVYVVLQRMTAAAAAALLAAASETTGRLAKETGGEWRVETFRAPVQPSPRAGTRQLHLLIDDLDSISATPRLLLWKYTAGGLLLNGEPLAALTPLHPRALREAAATDAAHALNMARRSVARRQILGRDWQFSPEPLLRARALDVRTNWHYRCLLKGAVSAGDTAFEQAMALLGHEYRLEPMAHSFAYAMTGWKGIKANWGAIARDLNGALRARGSILRNRKVSAQGMFTRTLAKLRRASSS